MIQFSACCGCLFRVIRYRSDPAASPACPACCQKQKSIKVISSFATSYRSLIVRRVRNSGSETGVSNHTLRNQRYDWTAIKPMRPNKPRGVRRVNNHRVLNGIFWVLRSAAPWRDLPETYGSLPPGYNRFVRWPRTLSGTTGRVVR